MRALLLYDISLDAVSQILWDGKDNYSFPILLRIRNMMNSKIPQPLYFLVIVLHILHTVQIEAFTMQRNSLSHLPAYTGNYDFLLHLYLLFHLLQYF